jgi:hypothetical protein
MKRFILKLLFGFDDRNINVPLNWRGLLKERHK